VKQFKFGQHVVKADLFDKYLTTNLLPRAGPRRITVHANSAQAFKPVGLPADCYL
jgi:hypothetical protein